MLFRAKFCFPLFVVVIDAANTRVGGVKEERGWAWGDFSYFDERPHVCVVYLGKQEALVPGTAAVDGELVEMLL